MCQALFGLSSYKFDFVIWSRGSGVSLDLFKHYVKPSTVTYEDVGNGWYRVAMTKATSNGHRAMVLTFTQAMGQMVKVSTLTALK